MKRVMLAVLLVSTSGSIGRGASGFEGEWTAVVPGPAGQTGPAVTFVFHVSEGKANGTVATDARTFDLVDVKIDGATISFAVDGEEQNKYSGTLKGNEIALQVKYPSHENGTRTWSFVARRKASTDSASASSVAGAWEGEVPRGGGRTIPAKFVFQPDGAALGGTVYAAGDSFPIEKGTMNGTTIAFRIGDSQGEYSGTVEPDEIRMKVKYDGGENGRQTLPFVLKRVR